MKDLKILIGGNNDEDEHEISSRTFAGGCDAAGPGGYGGTVSVIFGVASFGATPALYATATIKWNLYR